jgi:hypothetical protein
MYSSIRLLAITVWLATPAISQAQRAEMPAPTTFNVGDTWEWRQVDNRTKLEEAKVTVIVVNVDGILQFSNGITRWPIDKWYREGYFKPSPTPWRIWPLEIGKKWDLDADWERADGVSGNTRQNVEVVAYEEVTVPAGTFMAFKIVHRGWYRNSRGSSGRQDDTFWYAPDAKTDVRHFRDDGRNMYTRELITYKRGAP